MKDIVIFKTDTPEERMVIKTDLMYDDHEMRFTVMTVEGEIKDSGIRINPGDIMSVYEVSRIVADVEGIEAKVISSDTTPISVDEAPQKLLQFDLHAVVDRRSYEDYMRKKYKDAVDYEEEKERFPWIVCDFLKSVADSQFTLEAWKDGTPVTFGESCSVIGEVAGTKLTLKPELQDYLMVECDADLGVKEAEGVWKFRATIGDQVLVRELVLKMR